MRILEYIGLDTSQVAESYAKISAALARGDFRSADAKKLAGHDRLYRARLDYANRLLFTLVRHGGELCVLNLEIIHQHAYEKSRFLRGASIDEAKIPDVTLATAEAQAQTLRYLHPQRSRVHLLDKPISFDDAQEAVFGQPAPLIVVGSAGSGKTALTLERMKAVSGQVLYVTLSPFLAAGARTLYYGNGFQRDDQEVQFLSLRHFLETLHVAPGQEVDWSRFRDWFGRHRQPFRDLQPHQVWEEFRGVLTAAAEGVLSEEQYRALGVRQSIFAPAQRESVYALYRRYAEWLRETPLFDLNTLAHAALPKVVPQWDFVVVDEVQDLTPIQLKVLLKGLRQSGGFLLCGDSNQIVHPNFFSWSKVKSLFWQDAELAERQQLSVLTTNFRNAGAITRTANRLLKIKHRRFGSIDRESNFLVDAHDDHAGQVQLWPDQETRLRELDRQTRASHEVAVLVLHDEDKAEARKHFSTPLLFSVHEAKGLEYPQVILFRFVSGRRAEFAALAEGVEPKDLEVEELAYRRARDKNDHSLEVYKFFVNALYVALTRAVQNVYLVEGDEGHPLLQLLALRHAGDARVKARAATREEWQQEAHRLEQQGKQEQAEAIRRDVLKQEPPPWPRLDTAWVKDGARKLIEETVGAKFMQQLIEYGSVHELPGLVDMVSSHGNYGGGYAREQGPLWQKQLATYGARNFKEVLRQCEAYGVDHRTPMGLTPLIGAAAAGNVALVDALLALGADPLRGDDYGQNPLHWVLWMAFHKTAYAQNQLGPLYERLAPPHVDLQSGERLLRIDRRQAEYLLLQTLWVLLPRRMAAGVSRSLAVDTKTLLDSWQHFPDSVWPLARRKRTSLSNVLSRNEVGSQYAYNRAVFRRYGHGQYQLDLALKLRATGPEGETWRPLAEVFGLDVLSEFSGETSWAAINQLLAASAQPELPATLAKRFDEQYPQAERIRKMAQRARRIAERSGAEAAAAVPGTQRKQKLDWLHREARRISGFIENPSAAKGPFVANEPPWGPGARQRVLQRRKEQREAAAAAKAAAKLAAAGGVTEAPPEAVGTAGAEAPAAEMATAETTVAAPEIAPDAGPSVGG